MSRVFYPAARAVINVVLDGFGDSGRDSDPIQLPVIPRGATIHRNGYHQADSWELVFDANDFPIDPQQVRSGDAEIYLFQMPGLGRQPEAIDRQFASSETSPRDRRAGQTVEMESTGRHVDRFTFDNRPMIVGLFDDHSIELSESGKWITITGQDYTDYLARRQWPPTPKGLARRIPVGKRLDVWLGDILQEADPGRRLRVVVEGVDASALPMVGKNETKTNGRGIPIEQNTSYWDVIYKTVTRYSFVVFVRGLDVVISKPKNIHELATHDIKRMAWGWNLESLKLTRHLAKEKVPRIIVQGYDHVRRALISVEYPDTKFKGKQPTLPGKIAKRASLTDKFRTPKAKTSKPSTSTPITKLEDEYMIIPAYGVSDRTVLRALAEAAFFRLGSGERMMVARTRDLADEEGSSLMDLSAGDAVQVQWQDFNREVLENPDLPEEAKVQELVSRGYGEAVSQVIARNYTKLAGNDRPLRVREVTYEYDVESGLTIEMQLIDFVVVDGLRDAAQKPSTAQKKAIKAPGRKVGG